MTAEFVRRYIDPRHVYRRWVDPRLGSLKPADLITYLRGHGWKELPPEKNGLLAFQEPTGATAEGRPYCQFVPLHEDYNDYRQVVFELITGLAEFENRQASAIIDDILRPTRDGQPNGVAKVGEATIP